MEKKSEREIISHNMLRWTCRCQRKPVISVVFQLTQWNIVFLCSIVSQRQEYRLSFHSQFFTSLTFFTRFSYEYFLLKFIDQCKLNTEPAGGDEKGMRCWYGGMFVCVETNKITLFRFSEMMKGKNMPRFPSKHMWINLIHAEFRIFVRVNWRTAE